MDFDPKDFREIDGEFLRKAKVGWFTRALLSVSLAWGVSRLAKQLRTPGMEMSKKAHAFFAKVERVHIIPSRSGMRGFQIVLDNMLSLFFCQDGDHFVYDGFEMGPYDDGDVAVLDELK
jgi:hypothetical protein